MTDPTPEAVRAYPRLDALAALAKAFTPHALIALGLLAYLLKLPAVGSALVAGGLALLKGQG